jgi:oligosaccharide repeat unit polymerase
MATLSGTQLPSFSGYISLGQPEAARKTPRGYGVFFCQLGILSTLVMLVVAYRAFDWDAEGLIYPACWSFAALSLWLFWSWRQQSGKTLDPYTLFILAAVLFNGGQALLEMFRLNPRGFLGNVFPPESLLRALWFTMLGLASVHLGALLSLHIGRRTTCGSSVALSASRESRACAMVGIAMIGVSLLPWLMLMWSSTAAVMSYGYFVGLFQQESATSFDAAPSLLSAFLIPGALFLLAGSRRPLGRTCAVTILAAYCIGNFFLGSRAPATTTLVAGLWLWHYSVSRVRRLTVVLVGLGVALLIPLVATVRDYSMEARTSNLTADSLRAIGNPLVFTAAEMGNSMSTVAYTIELVPAVRGFDYGQSYFFASLTALPNLFWDLHPTSAHGLLSNWLVWTVDPGRAALNGGLGFSFLAEAFLNFGWYGAPFALLAVGLLLGLLVRWAGNAQRSGSFAAVACMLLFVLFFARGESASMVRGVLWYSLLPYAAVRLLVRAQGR